MPFVAVIVGTGIAGLATAIALAKKGHNVTVLEATSRLRPIGGVIVLQVNANRVLHHLGVYNSLIPFCNPVAHGPSTRRYDNGQFLASTNAEAHENRYGYPLWPVHRADLQQVLFEAALLEGVDLRLDCQVVAVEEDSLPINVILKSGETVFADVVVGADGINSTVRKNIAPDTVCVRDSGIDITRANIPAALIRSDPEISGFLDQISLWCGPSSSIATMAVRQGEQAVLGLDCCHESDSDLPGVPGRQQDIAQFVKHYKDYDSSIQKLLSYVTEANVWRLKEAAPLSWIGQSGRVIVVGDAAHGSLPWAGQGGGMALEDAIILSACLDRANDVDKIPAVLRAFQDIRQPRCLRVQQWSKTKGQRARLAGGPEQQKRDLNFAKANAWIKADPWDKIHIGELPEFEAQNWKAWLSGHDALDLARRELDKRFERRTCHSVTQQTPTPI